MQRHARLSELAMLGELRASHRADPLVALLIEAALLHTEANLRVLDAAEDRIEELASMSPVAHTHQERLRQAR